MNYISAMTLFINGEEKPFAENLTVTALLDQLGMKADRVAVELNRAIIPRAEWSDRLLQNGDRLEVVHFVGGG
jgi:sulfur carrier protein